MTRRILYLAPIVLLIVGAAVQYSGSRRSQPADVAHPAANSRIAAPGRVEPISEEIQVSPEIAGRLIEVRVDEGYKVRKGDTLAVIENSDYRARVAASEAALAQRRADLDRIENGARPQELEQARLAVDSAKTVLDNARSEMEHREMLLGRGRFGCGNLADPASGRGLIQHSCLHDFVSAEVTLPKTKGNRR